MTELAHEEVLEEDSEEQELVEAFDALREEPEEEVASTDVLPPEVEVPETHDEQEPTQGAEPELHPSFKTVEERDEWAARALLKEIQENPELGEAFVAIKNGQAVAIPREVLEAAQRYQTPEEPQADPDDDLYQDPFAVIKQLRQEVSQITGAQRQAIETRQRAEFEANTNLVTTVGEEFFRNHPELQEKHENIHSAIAEAQLIRRYRKRFPGDPRRAVAEAYDAAYRMEFPDAAAATAQRRLARDQKAKQRAGASAASPRSMPRNRPEEKLHTSKDRLELFTEILREEQSADS